MQKYDDVLNALRRCLDEDDCKLKLNETHCAYPSLFLVPKTELMSQVKWGGKPGRYALNFAFVICKDQLLVELQCGISKDFISQEILASVGIEKLDVGNLPTRIVYVLKDHTVDLSDFQDGSDDLALDVVIMLAWGLMDALVEKVQEVLEKGAPLAKAEDPNSTLSNGLLSGIVFNKSNFEEKTISRKSLINDSYSDMCLTFHKAAEQPRFNQMNMDCMVFPSRLPSEPPKKRQDVNHNQEVFFTLLNEASEKPQLIFTDQVLNENIHKEARECLERVRLYGIVLWDHNRDVEIDEEIEQYFGAMLDYAGPYFKFLALFSRYARKIEDPLIASFGQVKHEIVDDSFFTNAFLSALNVTRQDVPYFVITESLTAEEFLLVPIHGELDGVVKRLGRMAKAGRISMTECQKILREDFKLESEIRTLDDGNFAQHLIGPMTAIMLNPNTGLHVQVESAESRLNEACAEIVALRNRIKQVLADIERIDHDSDKYKALKEKYENFCMLQLVIAMMSAPEMTELEDFGFSRSMIENLDTESKKNLETAARALSQSTMLEDDLSPVAVALGKMFENEVNRSLVQFIRRELHIEMPKYFHKLCPNKSDYHTVDSVDFNRDKSGLWSAPEMGTSRHFMEKHSEYWNAIQSEYPLILQESNELTTKMLYQLWREVCDCRNNAAHPNENGYSAKNVEKMQEALQSLDHVGCFTFFKKLRQEMQG